MRRSVGQQPPEGQRARRHRALAGPGAARHADRLHERPQLLLPRSRRRKSRLSAGGSALLPHCRAAVGQSNVLSPSRGEHTSHFRDLGEPLRRLLFSRCSLPAPGGRRGSAGRAVRPGRIHRAVACTAGRPPPGSAGFRLTPGGAAGPDPDTGIGIELGGKDDWSSSNPPRRRHPIHPISSSRRRFGADFEGGGGLRVPDRCASYTSRRSFSLG